MYSLKYKVTTSTCDSEGRLELYSALQMMQDCSEMWIDSEPGIKQYFTEQNMAQLLATRQVEIVRVPEYKEELTVTTSVYGMKPMFGFRNTFIYDAEGNPCYKTWSMGAFVDKVAGKLKRVDDATIASMTLEPQLEMNYRDRRIILPKTEGEVQKPLAHHVIGVDSLGSCRHCSRLSGQPGGRCAFVGRGHRWLRCSGLSHSHAQVRQVKGL